MKKQQPTTQEQSTATQEKAQTPRPQESGRKLYGFRISTAVKAGVGKADLCDWGGVQ